MPDYTPIIDEAEQQYNLPRGFLHSVIRWESGGNPNDVSRTGAVGLGQLMPRTAQELGVTNRYDPRQNIMGAAKYLAQGRSKFGNDPRDWLSYYNSGKPYAQGSKIPGVTDYVNRILSSAGQGGQTSWNMPGSALLLPQGLTSPWGPKVQPTRAAVKPTAMGIGELPPPPPPPTPPDYTADQDALSLARRDEIRATHPYAPQEAEGAATQAGLKEYLAKLPAYNPQDPRYNYTPYTPEALPSHPIVPLPDMPQVRVDPLSQILAGIGGFISPVHAGAINAVPLEAALRQRQQQHFEDLQRQQMLQGQADITYDDALRQVNQQNQAGLFNFQGAQEAARAGAGAQEADLRQRADIAGQQTRAGSLLGAYPGLDQTEQNRLLARSTQADIEGLMALKGDTFKEAERQWEQQYSPYNRYLLQSARLNAAAAQGDANRASREGIVDTTQGAIDRRFAAGQEGLDRRAQWRGQIQQQIAAMRTGADGRTKPLTPYQKIHLPIQLANMGLSKDEIQEVMGPDVSVPAGLGAAGGLQRQLTASKLERSLSQAEAHDPDVITTYAAYNRKAAAQDTLVRQLTASYLSSGGDPNDRTKMNNFIYGNSAFLNAKRDAEAARAALSTARENYRKGRNTPQTPGGNVNGRGHAPGWGVKAGKPGQGTRSVNSGLTGGG
jgi:hypothetical protein